MQVFPQRRSVRLDYGYRADLVVGDRVIIDAKAVQSLNAQLLTYLKQTDCRLGLLINFNALKFKDGLKRVVNNLYYLCGHLRLSGDCI